MHSTKTSWFIALVAFLVVATVPVARAHASDDEAAVAEFQKGVKLFTGERYEEAVTAFRHANELNPTWKIFFNIGQCEAALKRYGLAIESFERYLGAGGDDIDSERRDYVYSEMRRLRDMVGSVHVQAPDGTDVLIDDASRGRTPLEVGIRVTAGVEHEVRFERDGKPLLSRRVTLGSGQNQTVTCCDEISPPPPESAGEPAQHERSSDGESRMEWLTPAYFWIGVGATGVFGATAIAMEIAIRAKWDQAKKDPANPSLKDDGRALQAVGITALCLTGVAAVATAVLGGFTSFGQDQPEDLDVALAPAVLENGGSLTLTGRF